MAISSSELDRVFAQSLSPRLQAAIIRCLFGSYRTAAEKCSEDLPEEEATVLLPLYRWLQLKANIRRLKLRFTEVESENGRYHALLSVGQINLTVSSVSTPGSFVRPATYRATYANDSQLHLFTNNAPPPANAEFYAILIHSADPKNHSQPLSAHFAFPDKGLTYWVHKIDLFARNAALVDELRAEATPLGGVEATVRLLRTKREDFGA